ncbi:MAG: glycosyltransferase [Roseburia sp.]
MRVMILSCGMGGGHNATAEAVCESLKRAGHEVVLMEHYLNLGGEAVDKIVCNTYINMVKVFPALFQAVYSLGDAISRMNHFLHIKSPVYYMNGKMAGRLQAYLAEHPVDAIVMPHLFPAETVTYMKKKGMALPLTVAVATDYTSIPFWEETDVDYYVIPHSSCVREFAQKGLPKERLLPFGIPVQERFTRAYQKGMERRICRLDRWEKNILLMGGSMGASQIAPLLKGLCREMKDCGIVVICGSNRRLYARLKREYSGQERVRIVGYTKRVADYMKACDLLYTKPGGASVTELAAVGIPTVFLKPISQCERANADFYTGHGLAYYHPTIKGQLALGKRLLASGSRRGEKAPQTIVSLDAGAQLCAFLEQKLESKCR